MNLSDAVVLAGVAFGVAALVTAWIVWSKLYTGVVDGGKLNRDDFRRFITKMGVLGIWCAVGWAILGVGIRLSSSGPSPLSEYIFPGAFCFGAGAGAWLLWILSLVVRLRARLQSQRSNGSQNAVPPQNDVHGSF